MARRYQRPARKQLPKQEEIRLNKFLANAGLGNRKEMDQYILKGRVKVNGKIVNTLGYRIKENDTVEVDDKQVVKGGVIFILLNKPKKMAASFRTHRGQQSLKDIPALTEQGRLFVVSPLDADSRGLLILTNDKAIATQIQGNAGQLDQLLKVQLADPFDKALSTKVIKQAARQGCKINKLVINKEDATILGIECGGSIGSLGSVFEKTGATVQYIDRTMINGLDKKRLARYQWRKLNEKEAAMMLKLT